MTYSRQAQVFVFLVQHLSVSQLCPTPLCTVLLHGAVVKEYFLQKFHLHSFHDAHCKIIENELCFSRGQISQMN